LSPTNADVVIPPRALVHKSAPDDPIDYYYRPLTGWLYRSRLEVAAALLGNGPFDSLLEVGYGSGVFLPELARRARRLAGVDVHLESAAVGGMLESLGIEAELYEASVFDLPFADGEFQAVVCLSVLEHLRELRAALDEMRRVLRKGGTAIVGFPVRNPLTDGFFRLVGYDPRAIHPSGHSDILLAIRRQEQLEVDRIAHFPRVLPLPLSAYVVCRLRAA
jgi:SAM-dependent methyltransferase